ncbi:MAG: site-2 protease family protein [Chloroflexales bacterium]|nr:site-2 protease family protein [Chloroflexales bacterium]
MKRPTIGLGRLLGIRIELDYSWFLVFALLTWSLATGYYTQSLPGTPALGTWGLGALSAVLLFGSVLLHELGHALVARRDHVPVRRITLFLFGGVAELGAEPAGPLAELRIALAGPAVSLALAVLFAVLQALAGPTPLRALFALLASINGTLALFNLLPGYPLDGGRVVRAALWGLTHDVARATRVAARLGQGIAYLFVMLGAWEILLGNLGGLWLALIGWFLAGAASAQVTQQRLHDLLAGHRVAEAMSRDYTAIPGDRTLQQLVDEEVLGRTQRCFMVEQDGETLGLLTLHDITAVPRSAWPSTSAAQAMRPAALLRTTSPDADLWLALEAMQRDGVNQLPVLADHHTLGLLSRDGVITFLRTRRKLGA